MSLGIILLTHPLWQSRLGPPAWLPRTLLCLLCTGQPGPPAGTPALCCASLSCWPLSSVSGPQLGLLLHGLRLPAVTRPLAQLLSVPIPSGPQAVACAVSTGGHWSCYTLFPLPFASRAQQSPPWLTGDCSCPGPDGAPDGTGCERQHVRKAPGLACAAVGPLDCPVCSRISGQLVGVMTGQPWSPFPLLVLTSVNRCMPVLQ